MQPTKYCMGIFRKFLDQFEEPVVEMAKGNTVSVHAKKKDGPVPVERLKDSIGHQGRTSGTGIHDGKGRERTRERKNREWKKDSE